MERADLLKNGIIFDAKPDAVPYNYRISYKVAQLCLILKRTAQGGCSLLKLHMVSTALSSRKDMDHLRSFCDLGYSQNYFVHFDPAVNRALKYAIAEKLVYQQRNTFFRLADKGKLFVQAIEVDQTVLAKEKRLLDELSRNLSEDKIKTLVEDWGRFDDKN